VTTPELSRLIKTRPLPGEVIVIEATAAERAALAERFGLCAIAALRAEVALEARPKAIRAKGRLTAAVTQPCAVSGEDFAVAIDTPLDLRFIEASAHAAPAGDEALEIELAADDCDEIEYTGEMFDLGEAVAQSLGLAIDPYAEGPDADAARRAAGIVKEGEQLGPLADLLAAFKKD
jgi:uncharacterized metal-binding protein YceD (DUF177 family)